MSEKLKRKRDEEESTSDPLGQDSDRKREKLDGSCVDVIPKENAPSNQFLVEALKKIVELQNQFNDLEDSSAEEDEDEDDYNDPHEYEAEALGFAMCARETLLFLKNEGLSQDDPIYRALRNRLVGRCQGVPI